MIVKNKNQGYNCVTFSSIAQKILQFNLVPKTYPQIVIVHSFFKISKNFPSILNNPQIRKKQKKNKLPIFY